MYDNTLSDTGSDTGSNTGRTRMADIYSTCDANHGTALGLPPLDLELDLDLDPDPDHPEHFLILGVRHALMYVRLFL